MSTAGVSLAHRHHPTLTFLRHLGEMTAAMFVGMIAFGLRRRGHRRRACAEMTSAMFVPVVAVLGCYWAGTIAADPVCPLSCVLMIPAMAVAMLFRLDTYARHAPVANA